MVVGVVLDRVGENYKVDIGGAHNASLPILGFEGASKKNRPILTVCVRLLKQEARARSCCGDRRIDGVDGSVLLVSAEWFVGVWPRDASQQGHGPRDRMHQRSRQERWFRRAQRWYKSYLYLGGHVCLLSSLTRTRERAGYLFKANLGLCRALLANDCLVLTLLGGRIPFEIAVVLHYRAHHHRVLVSSDPLTLLYLAGSEW